MIMDSYPRLSEEGKKQAQQVIDGMRKSIAKVLNDEIENFYVDIVEHIESDAWCNFRNQFIYAFRKMDRRFCGEYDLREIALAILKEFPGEIESLILKAKDEEIERQRCTIEFLRKSHIY